MGCLLPVLHAMFRIDTIVENMQSSYGASSLVSSSSLRFKDAEGFHSEFLLISPTRTVGPARLDELEFWNVLFRVDGV